MRIALVDSELLPVPPVLGGAVEQTLYETVCDLESHACCVISRWSDRLEGRIDREDSRFRYVDLVKHRARFTSLVGDFRPSGFEDPRRANAFYYLDGVADILKDVRPDIVQMHNRPEFVPYLLRQSDARTNILYMHNLSDYRLPRIRRSVEQLDQVVFVSHYLRRSFIRKFPGFPQGRLAVIHNSVDTDLYHPDRQRESETVALRKDFYGSSPIILFVGRTVPQKGIQHLIEAMELVLERLPKALLVVAGTPLFGETTTSTYHRRLIQRSKGLGDRVRFLGYVPHERTPQLYAACDIFVAPSVWPEPFGKVVTEAMASGKPVISSNRGGIPEIIDDGKSGFLQEDPSDSQSMANRIIELAESPAMAEDIGGHAREKALEFSRKKRIAELEKLYDSLQC